MRRATVLLAALIGTAQIPLVAMAQDHRQLTCKKPEKLDEVFRPPWISKSVGLVSTGLVAIPFQSQRRREAKAADPAPYLFERDLTVTNGNDLSPQPLTIFYNQRTEHASIPFREGIEVPEWFSKTIALHGNAAAGDINGDGLIDLAVAIIRDHPEVWSHEADRLEFRAGGVAVHYGVWSHRNGSPCSSGDPSCRPTLSRDPDDVLLNHFGPTSVSLGDVNGDGYLDLAVAPAYTSDGLVHVPGPDDTLPADFFPPGQWRIYAGSAAGVDFSRELATSAPDQKFNSGDVELADVDQDGLLDLVLTASARLHVFKGVRDGAASTISPTPYWSSTDSFCLPEENCADAKLFGSSLDTGFLSLSENPLEPDPNGLVIAVATSCLQITKRCPGAVLLYQPKRQTTQLWRTGKGEIGWGGELRLRDMDGDCQTDLVNSPWWDNPSTFSCKSVPTPASPRIYQGDGGKFGDQIWTAEGKGWVAQSVELADFDCSEVTLETFDTTVPELHRIVTIHDPDLELIHGAWLVDPNGVEWKKLGREEVTWVIGEPWLMVAGFPKLPTGSKLRIRYTRSLAPDVAIGSWGADRGVSVFQRFRGATATGNQPASSESCVE